MKKLPALKYPLDASSPQTALNIMSGQVSPGGGALRLAPGAAGKLVPYTAAAAMGYAKERYMRFGTTEAIRKKPSTVCCSLGNQTDPLGCVTSSEG